MGMQRIVAFVSVRHGIAKRLFVLLPLLWLAACASGAVPGAMSVPLSEQTLLATESRLRQAVAVGTVGGGRETNPLWTSQVSSADFAEALRLSLSTHAMLAINNQAFRLDATLADLQQPIAGLDLTVTSRVTYRLIHLGTGAAVFEREIAAPYTAPFSAAFAAVERLRLANEGSIRENIRQFLAALIAAERANPLAFATPRG